MLSLPKEDYDRAVEICTQEGFHPSADFNRLFRFDIIKDQEMTFILGVKIPLVMPLAHKPPVELASFYVSMVCRPKRLEEPLIRYLAASFHEVVNKLSPYSHDYNLERYKEKINTIIAEYYPDESLFDSNLMLQERKVNSYIRDKSFKDTSRTDITNLKLSQDILDIYRDFNLLPTNDVPPEFSLGLPIHRVNHTVFFHNAEFNDWLVEEPGAFGYWRDYITKNVWLRSAVQSITPNVWYSSFNDQNFNMNYLFYDWIIYCRGLIKQFLSIFDTPQFQSLAIQNTNGLQSFSDITMRKDFFSHNAPVAFWQHPLVFETQSLQDISPPDRSFFESPPCGLEELTAVSDYEQAKALMERNHISGAKELLLHAKRKLKKFHHILAQVKILFRLNDIAKIENNYQESLEYLAEIQELCKTGKIPIPFIIHMHLQFAWTFVAQKDVKQCNNQIVICLKFLESSPSSPEINALFPRVFLEVVRINMKLEDWAAANEAFKHLLRYSKMYPKYEFYYYYERGTYYEGVKQDQKRILALQKAITINNSPRVDTLKAYLALGKYFLYTKSEPKQALEYLKLAEKLNTQVDLDSLKLRQQTYEMLADTYIALHSESDANFAKTELKTLREKIDRLI